MRSRSLSDSSEEYFNPADSKPHQKITEAQKAKEFFDPNFIPTTGDFSTKNLSNWELLVWGVCSSARTIFRLYFVILI